MDAAPKSISQAQRGTFIQSANVFRLSLFRPKAVSSKRSNIRAKRGKSVDDNEAKNDHSLYVSMSLIYCKGHQQSQANTTHKDERRRSQISRKLLSLPLRCTVKEQPTLIIQFTPNHLERLWTKTWKRNLQKKTVNRASVNLLFSQHEIFVSYTLLPVWFPFSVELYLNSLPTIEHAQMRRRLWEAREMGFN
jgi:hypothetical protein